MNFEWDSDKAASNQQKHGVTFHEAATVFGDPVAITFSDPDHSARESRYLTVGMSQSARILIVSHTDRGENVRIISARKTTRSERRFYEEGK